MTDDEYRRLVPCEITPLLPQKYGLMGIDGDRPWLEAHLAHINSCPHCLPVALECNREVARRNSFGGYVRWALKSILIGFGVIAVNSIRTFRNPTQDFFDKHINE